MGAVSKSKPVPRRVARPPAGPDALGQDSERPVVAAGGGLHVLPPRMGAKAASRPAPAAGASPVAAPAASDANITIARRKRERSPMERPMAERGVHPAQGGNIVNVGGSSNYYDDNNSGGMFAYHEPYTDYSAYDDYQPQYESTNSTNAAFFGGGGGHFLRGGPSLGDEESFNEDQYDNYDNSDDRLSRRNDFRKRGRFGGFGFDDGSSSGMSRTEQLLQYGVPGYPSPYSDHHSDHPQYSHSHSEESSSFSRDGSSSFSMGRTHAMLNDASSSNYTQPPRPPLPKGKVPGSDAASAAAKPPPAAAPEPKKIDPSDLFALLAANGLF
jgi:hypothetical protein